PRSGRGKLRPGTWTLPPVNLPVRLVVVRAVFGAQTGASLQHVKHEGDGSEDGENDSTHGVGTPPICMLLNSSTNLMTPGPTATTKNAGSSKKTSGKISLTDSLAARSSARWRRLTRASSA